MTSVTNSSSNHHLVFVPKFQSCLKTRHLASRDDATSSTLAPGESAALSHPKYTISASLEPEKDPINHESISTRRSADEEGVEVVNGGQKTLVVKSSDEDEDDIVIEPGESATLESDKYDIEIEGEGEGEATF